MIFTGKGKGKTSAAIGTCLRSIAESKTVYLIQFLKSGNSGEVKCLKNFKAKFKYKSFGKNSFTKPDKLTKKDFDIARKGVKESLKAIDEVPFLLVLDEILITLEFGLTKERDIIRIVNKCNENQVHLILTGRGANENLIELADLVTEMKCIKHPFDKDHEAIKGIDY